MRIPRTHLNGRLAAGVAALATLTVLSPPARAVVITVDGVEWTINATQVRPDTNLAGFRTTFISSQPWNGSATTAGAFAQALGGQLGYPNDLEYGPFFAYSEVLSPPPPPGQAIFNTAVVLDGDVAYTQLPIPSDKLYTYATATRANSSVPGPLPLLGGMAAFGWSRRLRRRVLAPRA